ncbi:MAG TPA: QueT transporter family protein [Candidatus Bathyarchaeia archaeon]|nr:QueT transporter family protein [Candidatus Bathyarchaeia archaeon]
MFASLYAVLVWLLPGLSFAAVQFRIAEGLKPAIAKKWTLAFAFALGNFLGNLISPFAGIYELGFMPLMNIVGGLLAYTIARSFKRNYLIAGLVYAAVIGLSVSWMLHVLFNLPLEALVPLLITSEEGVMVVGAILFYLVDRRWRWYQ